MSELDRFIRGGGKPHFRHGVFGNEVAFERPQAQIDGLGRSFERGRLHRNRRFDDFATAGAVLIGDLGGITAKDFFDGSIREEAGRVGVEPGKDVVELPSKQGFGLWSRRIAVRGLGCLPLLSRGFAFKPALPFFMLRHSLFDFFAQRFGRRLDWRPAFLHITAGWGWRSFFPERRDSEDRDPK